ncbi:MAG TPA: F0F1 ATP synthase subunit delta [Patescibacteria group bacterium]|nr:F0F1 ATP synthase subunit delta [Patescibacteria group bacterium]
MSSRETLSRPYARAAFELGKGHDALSDWSAKLGFAAEVAAAADVVALIGNPRVTTEQLKTLFLPDGEATDGAFALFVAQLAANRRLALLPDIAAQFEHLKRESERRLKVRVKTAVALEATQADAIKVALAKRFARDIIIESSIDPSLLGGALIDAEGLVIDASVRGKLDRLGQALAQ